LTRFYYFPKIPAISSIQPNSHAPFVAFQKSRFSTLIQKLFFELPPAGRVACKPQADRRESFALPHYKQRAQSSEDRVLPNLWACERSIASPGRQIAARNEWRADCK
jgi:hypothetical protein